MVNANLGSKRCQFFSLWLNWPDRGSNHRHSTLDLPTRSPRRHLIWNIPDRSVWENKQVGHLIAQVSFSCHKVLALNIFPRINHMFHNIQIKLYWKPALLKTWTNDVHIKTNECLPKTYTNIYTCKTLNRLHGSPS